MSSSSPQPETPFPPLTESSAAPRSSAKPRRKRTPKPSPPPPELIPPVEPPSSPVEPPFESPRRARPVPEPRLLTPETFPTYDEAYAIWRQLESMPYFLDDSCRNPYIFERSITDPSSTVYLLGRPAQALLWGHSIIDGYSGVAAIAVWGREALGQHSAFSSIMRAIMKARRLHRASAYVAAPNRSALRLAARLGFHEEGLIRKGMCYHGVWEDVVLFGILAEELG